MRSDRRAPVARGVGALLLLLAAAGCAHTRLPGSAIDAPELERDELQWWQSLESRPLLTNHDALHGLLLLADGRDERASWHARLTAARARGWIDEDEAPEPDETAEVGLVSVAVVEMLGIRGGVTLRLLGSSPRYCTRELVFEGLLPKRTRRETMSGLEFVDLAGRVEDWRERRGGAAAAAEAGGGGGP